jgi:hypothetical protein
MERFGLSKTQVQRLRALARDFESNLGGTSVASGGTNNG